MRIKSIYMILMLLTAAMPSMAYNRKTDSIIGELNKVLERRDKYFTMHKWQIDSVKKELLKVPEAETERRYALTHEIFNRYRSFQGDSALLMADRALELAKMIGDRDAIVRAQGDKLFALVSKGNFPDAADLVRSTDMQGVSAGTRGDFYFVCIRLYSDMANYYDSPLSHKYAEKSRAYADSVMSTKPSDSYEAQYASIFNTLDDLTETQKAEVFTKLLNDPKVNDSEKATIASIIADIALRLGEREKGIQYKALSSIYDITNSKRETSSLRSLADIMFQDSQYELASRYVNAAWEDAVFYNAPQRKGEIANVMPLIESQRYTTSEGRRHTLAVMLCICGALVIVLIIFIIFYVKAARRLARNNKLLGKRTEELQEANGKLAKANENLGKANNDLEQANDNLAKANRKASEANEKLEDTLQQMRESVKIKDEYLGYTFYTNSEYIKRIENLYMLVKRRLKNKQYDDLASALNIDDISMEKKRQLKDFDHVFLRIFPTYIEQYERLFEPKDPEEEESKSRKSDGDSVLTPEMRIFALIRLGVTDISKIALFLDYSVNTVNTYKTRAKNRSKLPNEQFEPAIMEIKSV